MQYIKEALRGKQLESGVCWIRFCSRTTEQEISIERWDKITKRRSSRRKNCKSIFTDHVAVPEELQNSLQFTSLMIRQPRKVLCVVLYMQEQVSDLARFCSHHSSILLPSPWSVVNCPWCGQKVQFRRCPWNSLCSSVSVLTDETHLTSHFLWTYISWEQWHKTLPSTFFQHIAGHLAGYSHYPVLGSEGAPR